MDPFLVLASGSPRRSRILSEAGIAFELVPPQVVEIGLPGETPAVMVVRLAGQKAREVADRVIFFDEGTIVEQNTPSEFFSNPKSDRTKLFLSQILHH